MARCVLRDLLGVAEFEARLERIEAHPNPEFAPERDGIDDAASRLARRLFGIDNEDTRYWDEAELSPADEDRAWRDWELNFRVLDPVEEAEDRLAAIFWDAAGWDITDTNGLDLYAMEYLGRPLICALKGLRGHLPGAVRSDAEVNALSQEWGRQLSEAAERFRREKRK